MPYSIVCAYILFHFKKNNVFFLALSITLQKGASCHNYEGNYMSKTLMLPFQSMTISALHEACEPGFFYCNFHYTVTKYWDVGYDHLHAVWGLKYCSCCHYVLIYYWLKMSRDSHVSGVEPMRAETLFQTTAVQSS